jgi:hypothetical protein
MNSLTTTAADAINGLTVTAAPGCSIDGGICVEATTIVQLHVDIGGSAINFTGGVLVSATASISDVLMGLYDGASLSVTNCVSAPPSATWRASPDRSRCRALRYFRRGCHRAQRIWWRFRRRGRGAQECVGGLRSRFSVRQKCLMSVNFFWTGVRMPCEKTSEEYDKKKSIHTPFLVVPFACFFSWRCVFFFFFLTHKLFLSTSNRISSASGA